MVKPGLPFRIVCMTVLAWVILASCGPATPAIGGIVQGAVYGDMNGNGSIDPGELVLDGAEVSLADCGPNQSQVTGVDGLFNFANLPAGTCHVSVSKAGWIFSGSYPSLGYPVPVASNPELATSFSLLMAPVINNIPTVTPPPASPTESPTTVPSPTSFTPTAEVSPTSSAAMVTPKTEPANCRFGPGTAFSSVGGLKSGSSVPIHATIAGMSWWQIESPQNPGTFCWVSAAVTNTFGNLTLVPIVPIPTGLVTSIAVSVSSGAVLHGFCGGPNAVNFQVTITTNGPATVIYHVSIYNADGTFRNSPGDTTLTFVNSSTQTFDPGGAYKTDCGNYYIQAIVTSPNILSAQADWTVVQP
jgi:uncharacterized protein YraI